MALAATAPNPHEGISVATNELGTDTDTIATMAGALLGACNITSQPPEDPLDSAYLLAEADRLIAISQGQQTDSYQYPDILTWAAPQAQADALVADNGQLAVEGLGPVKELDSDLAWSAPQGLRLAMAPNRLRPNTPHQTPPRSPTPTSWQHSDTPACTINHRPIPQGGQDRQTVILPAK